MNEIYFSDEKRPFKHYDNLQLKFLHLFDRENFREILELCLWRTFFNQFCFIAEKDKIKKDLTDFWNYEKIGCPHKEGSKYFFSRNSGLQNQGVVYVQDSLESEPRVLFDPNTLAEDGTISLGRVAWSEDGLVMAYALSTSGSDWQVIKFRNVETGEERVNIFRKKKRLKSAQLQYRSIQV